MPYVYVCPRCRRPHSVEERTESAFCRKCGTYLSAKTGTMRTEPSRRAKKVERVSEGIFPYDPYPEQLQFMNDIRSVVGAGGVLVAEACNGFGKTICALSALLPLNRRIIYATRTHEQARQVLEEMERINIKASAQYSAVNLASRHHLCLDRRCSQLSAGDGFEACRILREEDRCAYRWNLKSFAVRLPPILSIGDLRRVGNAKRVCPYYLARKAAESYRVVVAPYQYVFDPAIRERVGLQLAESFLVFDEAHNADAIGLDVLSDTLSDRALSQAKQELQSIGKPSEILDGLIDYLNVNVSDATAAKPGHELYNDMKLALAGVSIASIIDSYSKAVELIRTRKAERGEPPICHLAGVLSFLSLLETSSKECYVALYRRTKYGLKLIEYRCLDPSLATTPVIDQVHGTLIMSGTLAPIELFTQILALSKAQARTYSAIAKPENIRLRIDSSVSTRFSERGEAMMHRYGEKIAETISSTPNGVLVFFPQRGFMLKALDQWQKIGIVEQRDGSMLLGGKRVYVEGEDAAENRTIVEEYKRTAQGEGAVLLCVFRGRNAEGSNFPDEQARGVILVGVPYADISDPFVKARIEYLNRKERGLGERWYVMDAFRAANQAIGRGIRHREDWCIFTLMDQRYSVNLKLLSSWVLSGNIAS